MNATLLLLALAIPADEGSSSDDNVLQQWLEDTYLVPKPVEPAQPVEEPTPILPQYSSAQLQLLNYTQAYNRGLSSHSYLMNSAQAVADYHARTGRWGHSARSSRPGASENIAWNSSKSIDRISRQWKSSRGHNSNWLSNWNYVGVGVAYSNNKIYAVQHFANNPSPHNSIALQGRSSRTTTYSTSPTRRGWFGRRRR
jgi:hypothetical protein